MKQKLIVFSADALVHEDMAILRAMPNFRKYLQGGACMERVRSVYPTITYCCHSTMASGMYPEKHGLAGNLQFTPGNLTPPWKWFHSDLKCEESIFKAAKEAGLSTAAVYWPVTGNNPYIDYLIDEYWLQDAQDTILKCYERSGSSPEVLEIVEKYSHGLTLRKHPECDEFVVSCAAEIIRRFNPDVLFLHPANIDSARHQSGAFSEMVEEEVRRTDSWIGRLMEAEEEAGCGGCTNFVLCSDHGQMDIERNISLNVLLAERGYITVNPDGSLKSWDAYCFSGGMSALVYLRDPADRRLYSEIYALLTERLGQEDCGYSAVMTREEFQKEHLDGAFSFVLETDGRSSFGDRWLPPMMITRHSAGDYRLGKATHGYLPRLGPQPVFYAKGPGFRENVTLAEGRLVDIAPTCARLLGLEIPGAQGKAVRDLLRA